MADQDIEKYWVEEQEKLLEQYRSQGAEEVCRYSPVPFDIHPWNDLTVFLIENSDNSDITKKWRIGVKYHNNLSYDWRICYPRNVSCRPLRLELYFTGYESHDKTRLYPSCNFINMPNKYKTIKPGQTYDHIIDISPWRDSKGMWRDSKGMWRDSKGMWRDSKGDSESLEKEDKREKGAFSIIITYPHAHHYVVGTLKWMGWY
jgi:hypothetical protein